MRLPRFSFAFALHQPTHCFKSASFLVVDCSNAKEKRRQSFTQIDNLRRKKAAREASFSTPADAETISSLLRASNCCISALIPATIDPRIRTLE